MRKLYFALILSLVALNLSQPAAAQTDFNQQGALCVNIDSDYIAQLETETINETVEEEARIVEPSAVLLIVDGSGSMTELIEGTQTRRMDAAQTVLSEYVSSFAPEDQVGLRLLNGNCETELLRPIAPVGDAQDLIDQINGISPEGSTPLGAAIEAAGEDLAGIEGQREIILVTDGQETCDGDPVGAASALAASDPDLLISINVVGFNVLNDVPAQDNLRLIPRAANGVFVSAQDEEDLTQALSITERIPFFVNDSAGSEVDDGLANRSSLALSPETYLISVPALNIADQSVTVVRGRGVSLNVAADGSVSVNDNDPDCVAEFCPEVPLPRLVSGERGRVTLEDPRAVNVRNNPGTEAALIGQLDVGEEFAVLDGPLCRDGYLWWHVQNERIDGWAAEGIPGNYFLEPYNP